MLAPGSRLQNRYRIIRLLGQGGMGAVYEAMDERLDTNVALKETLFADERLRKQFEREARLLARMHHPALPRVSDHFEEGDGQFLVMQFIPGDDLSQMMTRKQGPFPPDQVLTWGDQLLDALDYLHTQDPPIIHRDIKPQNLKITGRGQIILLDFGLAKGQTGGPSVVTTSASIYGYTPNYAPLEQIQGLGTDARSDIYALSATLYHLMTAVKPPDALTRAAALVNGQPDPLAPANQITQNIGAEVTGVLARAMSQNRDQRYSTAAAMRAALKGTGEAATLVGRTEAPTVLLPPSANTLAAPAEAETLKGGETTVMRSQNPAARRRFAPWAIGLASVALIGILFGAFYAYQRRKNSTAATIPATAPEQVNHLPANATAAPSHEPATNEPASGALNEEKKLAVATPLAANQAAKKSDKAVRNNAKQTRKPTEIFTEETPDVRGEFPNVQAPNAPNLPPTNGLPNRDGGRRMGATTVRNLPDGTQVMTFPNGTRLIKMPNGSQRMLGPDGRVLRRKPKE